MIIVIGHTNPDTDNIAASIGLARLLMTEGRDASAYKKGNLNKETQWVLEYTKLSDQIKELSSSEDEEKLTVFFVDFNEEAQSPLNPENVELVGLIDHHKLSGSWRTEEPILFRIEPVGSSSTLVAKMYQEKGIAIPDEIARILLCGIVSDTLKLTSPTTSEEDKIWTGILAEQTEENVEELADNLFAAKSDLSSFTPEEIAKLDYKNFNLGGKKVGFGVIETVMPDNAKKIEKELKDVMQKMKAEENLDFIFLGIVDIINNETEILLISPEAKDLIMKSFSDIVIRGENLILKGVVSRKKQIIPAIERVLKEMKS
ncbi:MAG: manganese-dependent inorganic pyrophosphatase [Candidatus Moraniibacteriota bacterium]